MEIGERIKQLRIERGLTQEDLAEAAHTTKQTIHKYETGIINNIPASKIKAIADRLSTTPDYLMGWKDTPSGVRIPVLGSVAAGIPIEAIEDIIDYEEIPTAMARSGEYFGLLIKGQSMEPNICNGDILIVRKQSDIESGNIAVVLVNGEEGTCKKILKSGIGITLVSFNPAYDPVFFSNKQIKELPVTIVGKAVEIRRKLS